MRRFLKNIFFFFSFSLSIFIVILIYFFAKKGITSEDIPPPNFSNSYSFNDKALFSHSKKADVLAIGSSTSLNNLYSETVVNKFKNTSYMNTGSWGLCIKDFFELLKIYNSVYKPKTCIISSNLSDFEEKMISIRYSSLKDFLMSDTSQIYKYHFRHFSAKYYFKYWGYSREVKHEKDNYEFLGYDNYGAVLFDSLNFKKNESRWLSLGFENPQQKQYLYLDSIAAFCMSNHIQLLFFQSPFRIGLYSKGINALTLSKINEHIKRVKKIVTNYGFEFINSNEIQWGDSLFVDASHFNSVGAKLYTEYCFKHLK